MPPLDDSVDYYRNANSSTPSNHVLSLLGLADEAPRRSRTCIGTGSTHTLRCRGQFLFDSRGGDREGEGEDISTRGD